MYRIVSRVEAGLPAVVTNSNGTPRPPLDNEPYMTAHYTGNNIDYTGKDAAQVTREIQRVFSKTKPFEYNYVIGQNEDDQIIEYAGHFQAAHSAGENQDSFGVLFLLGVGEPVTPTMINKWRWLRETLQYAGELSLAVDQRMHFQMPGAATACPGNYIKASWSQFLLPYVPPTPPFDEEEIMIAYIAQPPAGMPGNPPWLLCVNGAVRYATEVDSQYAQAAGWAFVRLNAEQYPNLLKSAGL
jgi:hypothetical protein